MARKTTATEDQGAYTSGSAPTSEYETPPMMEAPKLGDATEHGNAPVEAPPVPRYRVERSQYIMQAGGRVILREGKVIDGLNYNIEQLISQGVQLTQVA